VLTPREWEVLALIREGLTNDQIAERLGISGSGARFHVAEILSKLGVESRREAAQWREPRKPFAPFALGTLLMKSGAAIAIAVAVLALGLLAVGVLAIDSGPFTDDNSAAAPTPAQEQQSPALEADVAGVLIRLVNVEYSSTSTTLHLELHHPYLDTSRLGYLFVFNTGSDLAFEGFESVERTQATRHRASGGIDRTEMRLGAVRDLNQEVKFEIRRLCLFPSQDAIGCDFRDGPWTFAWVPATGPLPPAVCGQPPGPVPPSGFLTPGYLPSGFARKEDEYQCGAGGITGFTMHVFYQSGATLTIVQDLKPGYDLDAEMTKAPTQTRIAFGGGHAYRTQNDAGNKFSVTWSAGNDLIAYVTGTYVSFEEVLLVAESMR
jgi:DNA-binding CsgD family transcriptional regulator